LTQFWISCNHTDGCNLATSNMMCEAARVECEEGQTLHDPIQSFVPQPPPFSR